MRRVLAALIGLCFVFGGVSVAFAQEGAEALPDFSARDAERTGPEGLLAEDILVYGEGAGQQEPREQRDLRVEQEPRVEQEAGTLHIASASGQCGDENSRITWTMSNDGTLTLTGKGNVDMFFEDNPFGSDNPVPWKPYLNEIRKVVVGSGIVDLGQRAFADCPYLTSVTLPETLKNIGNCTFQGSGLEELTLPDSLTSLQATAVLGSNITTIRTKTSNAGLKVVGGAVFSRNGKSLFLGPLQATGSYSIPSGVVTVHEYAFCESQLTYIGIPNTVKTIEFRAFAGSAIRSITIPDSVTDLGIGVCTNCDSLEEAKVGNNVPIMEATFDWCGSLRKCVFGKGLKKLDATFRGCGNLTGVTLPNGLQEIGWAAFYQCEKITSIVIPNTVTTIGEGAFYETGIRSITFPKSVTSIGEAAVNPGTAVTILNPNLKKNSDGSYSVQNAHTFTGTFDYARAYGVLSIVNKERSKRGKAPLKMDRSLLDSAMQRAAETGVLFSHTRPSGRDCFTVNRLVMGENICMGPDTAAGAMNSWMNSQGHRDNILQSDYTTIGVGCFYQDGACYWVQLFGINSIGSGAARPANRKATVSIDIGDTTKGELREIHFYLDCTRNKALPGATAGLTLEVGGLKANPGSVTWKSSNPKAVQVNSKGQVTFRAKGNSRISANSLMYKRADIAVACVSTLPISSVDTLKCGNAVYSGKAIKPGIKAVYCGKGLKKGTDYTVTYSRNVNVGFGKATVRGKGRFTGRKTITFRIDPKGHKISSVKKGKRSATVKWRKLSKKKARQISGFQVQYSMDRSFKGAKIKKVPGKGKKSVRIGKLKKGKVYYFRLRTYKTVNGKKLCSTWSKVKKVRVR